MPPPSSTRTRLVRPTHDRIIAGVASGLARHLNVDPVLVRIGFVVLTVAGGVGLIGYAAGWVLIPPEDDDVAPTERDRGPSFWVGIGLLVVAALMLIDGLLFVDTEVGWAIVIIAAGLALWHVDRSRREQPDDPPPSRSPSVTSARENAAPTAASPSATSPASASATDDTEEMAPAAATREPAGPPTATATASDPTPRRHRERSILGRLTVAMALLAAGIVSFLDGLDVVDVSAAQVTAGMLLIVGAGLLVGTWLGRARWLIVPGLLLVPLVVVTSLAAGLDIPLTGPVGERNIHVSHVDGPAQYRHGIGQMTLDLRELDTDGGTVEIDASIAVGEMEILLPADTTVEIDATVQAGQLRLPAGAFTGPDVRRTVRITGPPGTGLVRLDAHAGYGQIDIRD